MAWMQCRSCSAKFAVGLLRCPQCHAVSELYAAREEVIEAEKEASMPKITVGGGASNAAELAEVVTPDPVPADVPEALVVTEPDVPDSDQAPAPVATPVRAVAAKTAAKATAAGK